MISARIMCQDAVECLGWPYVSPGSNNAKGIDCSGLFVYLFRKQGASIYHGSNTIYRQYTTENKGKLNGDRSKLKPGYAVFKLRAWSGSETDRGNRWYNTSPGNIYHIGLVRSVDPLIVEHATSAGKKCVVEQRNLNGWAYYGELKNVDYSEGGEKEMARMIVTCTPGETVKLRKNPSTAADVVMKIPNGTTVDAEEYSADWRKVYYNDEAGYMMAKFLTEAKDETAADESGAENGSDMWSETVTVQIPYRIAYEMRDALIRAIGNG